MAIIRGHHSFDSHFTQIPNEWLRDSRLSLKAIGLLAQLMSHNPGWNLSIRSLAKANSCGFDTIKSAIEELENAGYLRRSEQKHDESGRFIDFDFITCDPIEGALQNPVTVKPRHGETGHKEEHTSIEEKTLENNKRINVQFFETFYKIYPRKQARIAAQKAFDKAVASGVDPQVIIEGAERLASDPNLPAKTFIPHPATWLNGGGWDDEPLPTRIMGWNERLEVQAEKNRRKREIDIRETQKLIEQTRQPGEAPPTCEHGKLIINCMPCARKL